MEIPTVSHLTREEAAAAGRCSRDKVDSDIKAHRLRAVKMGRRVLIPRESVEKWLEGTAAVPAQSKQAP
jgi:excisionase family DNA binding protein